MKISVLILGTAVLAQFSVCVAGIPLTVQDLPQYGVSLIPSSNPAFEGMFKTCWVALPTRQSRPSSRTPSF